MRYIVLFGVLVLGFAVYVRLAPTDAARWHVLPVVTSDGDVTTPGGHLAQRRMTASADVVLQAIADAALATPRTRLIAGDVTSGMLTFQTRSALWGFPDQTTVAVTGDRLVIYGRLRFGSADLGVNKARVENWLAAVGPLTVPL